MSFRVAADGTRSVVVSDAEPWLSALGLGTSGALPITIGQGGTGATTAADAIQNLGGRTVKSSYVSASTNRTITFTDACGCLMIAVGNGTSRCGLYLLYCSTASSVPIIANIAPTTHLTLTASAGKIVVSADTNIYFDLMVLQGSTWANRIAIT